MASTACSVTVGQTTTHTFSSVCVCVCLILSFSCLSFLPLSVCQSVCSKVIVVPRLKQSHELPWQLGYINHSNLFSWQWDLMSDSFHAFPNLGFISASWWGRRKGDRIGIPGHNSCFGSARAAYIGGGAMWRLGKTWTHEHNEKSWTSNSTGSFSNSISSRWGCAWLKPEARLILILFLLLNPTACLPER